MTDTLSYNPEDTRYIRPTLRELLKGCGPTTRGGCHYRRESRLREARGFWEDVRRAGAKVDSWPRWEKGLTYYAGEND